MNRPWKHILNRETLKLAEIMDKMVLTDIYKTFYPKTKEYTFFSAPHDTFSNTYHIIDHKKGLNRYKKIEITPYILSDHHRLRLVFNSNKTTKSPHTHGSQTMPYSKINWSRKE